jgi:aspartokinase
MTDLKIRVFKNGKAEPNTTVTVPGNVLNIASKLIPKRFTEILQDKGIDIDELIKLSENPEAQGTLIEIEEHKKNEKVVIALE